MKNTEKAIKEAIQGMKSAFNEITEGILNDLREIQKDVDELKQPFEVGDYVQYNNDPNKWGFITKPVVEEADWVYVYSPQHEEEAPFGTDLLKKLTTSQYLEKMDAEAKRRGLVAGVKVKSHILKNDHKIEGGSYIDSRGNYRVHVYGLKPSVALFSAKTRKWAKIVKGPLLVTEDGEKLYLGDTVYWHQSNNVAFRNGVEVIKETTKFTNTAKLFSTSEARDEYINQKEKKYSREDAADFIGWFTTVINTPTTETNMQLVEQWEKSREG